MQIKDWLFIFNEPLKKIRNVSEGHLFLTESEMQSLRKEVLPQYQSNFLSFFALRQFYCHCLEQRAIKSVGQKNMNGWFNAIEVLTYAIILNDGKGYNDFLRSAFNYYCFLGDKLFSYFSKDEDKLSFATLLQNHKKVILEKLLS